MQPWFIPMFYVSGAVLGGLALPRIEQAYLDPDPDARLSVAAWVKATGVTNVCAPIALDASHSVWPIASADEIICIDMVHISPWEATLGVIKGAAAILPPTSPFYLYSPYIRGPERPSLRPEPSRSQPELGSARTRSGCHDGAIRRILRSSCHRDARKQSELVFRRL
jgi:hypothetical protein